MNLQHYARHELANGLVLACAPMPDVRSVSIGLFLGVGSRYERATEAGISHFLEHMLFKGCAGWPTALDIANEIEGKGGYLNASTGYENTSLWIKIGARHWQRGLELMANMAQHPRFDADECERERGVILDEINMYGDVPEDYVSQLCNRALWGDHPLGQEIAGEPETVAGLTLEKLSRFHAHAYRPDTAVLTVAGAVDLVQVREAATAYFGGWQSSDPAPTFAPAPDLPDQPRHFLQIRPTEQAHLQLAAPGLHRSHPDRFALSLLHALLGDGMSSRLWQRLREQRGLAYNIGSYISMHNDCGVFGVYGGCDARRLFETLDETMDIWRELQAAPVPVADLQHFKEYTKGRLELSSEDSSAVASWWGRQLAAGQEPITLDAVLAAIDAVTPADVQRLAQEIWQPRKLALGYVGPLEAERQLGDWLGEAAFASAG